MLPIVELRGGLPYGIALGLRYPIALGAAILGNMVPVPFIMLFIRRIFDWFKTRDHKLKSIICKLEDRAQNKGELIEKYRLFGLLLLVAIPLPGTGAWTGALVATILNIRIRNAFPVIFAGVCIAGVIMTAFTLGALSMVK
ncbi:MAG: small multi-drug export protein [Oscillospiraceae bacterium]|nr:small multi-drug export protein [Oscillospiraceae bacterium]